MADPSPSSVTTNPTLTFNSTLLFLNADKSLRRQQQQENHTLPPIPSDFPQSKLIPKTRFVIDGFKHSGDYSVSYFLSHFHSDHYTGLNPNWSNGIVFCSEITARLVVQVLKVDSSFVYALPLGKPVLIDDCEVVLIDANHCPGAVQFLFKVPSRGDCGVERYVHTGDFRFCDLMKLEPMISEYVGSDAVFLDTTYCNPKFVFPSQQESIDYIVDVIEKVLGIENEGSVLFLVATYVIGKEKILFEISRRCKRKVYVDARKMSVLSILGYGESGYFTENESESNVHVVGWNVLGETWPYFRPNFVKVKELMIEKGYSKVVGFVPTGWTYEVKRNKFSVRTKESFDIHLVPYSEHSNYEELREYVRFLKPKRVIPTVGVDVEKPDSKHASDMRKHFAGLVDEMANKQEFLMGFYRASPSTEGKVEDNDLTKSSVSNHHISSDPGCDIVGKDELVVSYKGLNKEKEVRSSTNSQCILKPQSTSQKPSSHDHPALTDEEKEEIIQQLQDSLPIWATQTQMLDLIKIFGTNTVEAVSHFYEHETEFHEQVLHSAPVSTSQVSSFNDSASLSNSFSPKISPQKNLELSQSLVNKLTTKSPLIKTSASPGKRKKPTVNRSNKKVKTKPNLESIGPKQATITNFFRKVTTNVTQSEGEGTNHGQSSNDDMALLDNALKTYSKEIDQFIQIINGNDTVRNHAATILESTKGDISIALDIYYNKICKSEGGSAKIEVGLVACRKSVHQVASFKNCSSSKGLNSQVDLESVAGLSAQEISSDKLDTSLVSLQPEKYFPTEHACWTAGQPAPYIHLARTFELVEAEKGKIKATSMLCNMFRSLLVLSPEDVLPAVYLCTNKIAPDHENMERNIGGSVITAALKESCGTNKSRLKELYKSLGDLGDVAQQCRQTQRLLAPSSPLLVKEVYAVIRKISVQTGPGSTVRKKNLIVNLMRCCREKEIKYLVRTLVGNLRIGAMMRTVLPALAQAIAMSSSDNNSCEVTGGGFKEKLQSISTAAVEAYNMVPSFDLLVPSLINNGINFSSSTFSVIPGIPIKPMLAKIINGIPQVLKAFKDKAFTCEYKYDGQRAQIHKLADESIRVFSRNGDETTSRFPDLVKIVMESCKPDAKTFILDAEVVAADRNNGCKPMSFQELSARKRGGKASSVTVENIKVDICVFVFDVMFANGEQLLRLPLRQRRKYLKDLFSDEKLGYFEYAKETMVEADDALSTSEASIAKLNYFLDDAFRSSCEGLMVKTLDVDAGYFPSKRSDSWLKVKRDYLEGMGDSLDLVPIGAWHGNGRKAGWYSPFLMACYDPDTEEFQSVCRVMSGFSDSFYTEMKEFFSGDKILSKKPPYYQTAEVPDLWFSPELVWEIRGADFTVSPVHQAAVGLVHESRGISIRFPRFVRSVSLSDKKPEECSTSEDIAEMFKAQTRKMDCTVKE